MRDAIHCLKWLLTLCLVVALGCIQASALCGPAYSGPAPAERTKAKDGLTLPYIGFGRSTYGVSLGVFAWSDKLWLRNLSLRTDTDILPGVRLHSVIRSNGRFNTLAGMDPLIDEGYIEGYGFYGCGKGTLSGSLRIGRARYLRFPYPDAIAVFDQVPGVGDLVGGPPTGYNGVIAVLDYAHDNGPGLHATVLNDGLLEGYASIKGGLGPVSLGARVGRIAVRPEPLGKGAMGYSLFAGVPVFGMDVGVLYERLEGQPIRTGISVVFPTSSLTRILGGYGADFARSPRGVAATVPLIQGSFGFAKDPPEGSTLVGEVCAERIHTYWQNSQVRNSYEHRLSSWGRTNGPGVVAVVSEGPLYLQGEALVSPHNSFTCWEDLVQWERGRQGPAQVSQPITYRFYECR